MCVCVADVTVWLVDENFPVAKLQNSPSRVQV